MLVGRYHIPQVLKEQLFFIMRAKKRVKTLHPY